MIIWNFSNLKGYANKNRWLVKVSSSRKYNGNNRKKLYKKFCTVILFICSCRYWKNEKSSMIWTRWRNYLPFTKKMTKMINVPPLVAALGNIWVDCELTVQYQKKLGDVDFSGFSIYCSFCFIRCVSNGIEMEITWSRRKDNNEDIRGFWCC